MLPPPYLSWHSCTQCERSSQYFPIFSWTRIEMDYREFIFMVFALLPFLCCLFLLRQSICRVTILLTLAPDLSLNLIFDFALKRHLSRFMSFFSLSSFPQNMEKASATSMSMTIYFTHNKFTLFVASLCEILNDNLMMKNYFWTLTFFKF